MSEYQIMVGDCLELLRQMPQNSVDSIVTDPPYGLTKNKKGGSGVASINIESPYGRARIGTGNGAGGFMGLAWDSDVPPVEVWAECLRVLKPGGYLLAFAGTRTQHRMACRIEDAGFEIRDMIAWIYGSGFPKSRNIAEQDMLGADSDQWAGWGTALKPSLEPITMARKPLEKGLTVAANVLKRGTGAINVDGCRVASDDPNPSISRRQGSTSHLSTRSAAESVAAGKLESRQSPKAYRAERAGEALGRWPANLIHDGSAEVVALFPAQAGAAAPVTGNEPTSNGFSGSVKYSGMRDRVAGAFHGDSGSAARFFYCAKTSRKDRNEGLLSTDAPAVAKDATMRDCETAEWSTRNGNSHPTVKPTDLMAYLLRLVTPPGGVALDPFMGSGSTGKAAVREGFQFIGCEIDEQYAVIARARIDHEITRQQELQAESDQLDLFGTA
ncbi:site-specific DNA-methyltransferase [Pseudomonas moraviensis]|uniref:DNA-methyltransferase n=1 Tax=Pseudomonas moraviensis TaxID=321662 RepID=UPI0020939BB0|nr:DNA methyltransferase [Pseudomonas moraviensis]UST60721.1 site-specific DNA-methyltransferase [Pseudomonas moraviensis]